ncbi:MAG TPA: hypothetical protein VJZ98_03920 [Actinomycetota bacterium]|nr:hypothetical protein [Actinomycetota bacterium]
MPFMIVAVLSVLVGCAVYLGTVRGQRTPPAAGFGETEPEEALEGIEPGAPAPGYAYLQVSTQGPELRERLQGLVGVIVLLGVGAAALAFALYELGHLINKTIEAFLD